ncbi:unnamed protein product [Closterium sp. NIES-54]
MQTPRTAGVNKQKVFKELCPICQVLTGAPKSERKFYPGLSAMLKSPDWEDAYPNLVKLWVVVAMLPLSTMECEPGFSSQNVIKSWLRGAIKDARLSDLMCMALLSYEPNWEEVVKIWRAYKKRKPFTIVAAAKKKPSAKGKEKVEEDGAGFVWGTETPTQMSMSDAARHVGTWDAAIAAATATTAAIAATAAAAPTATATAATAAPAAATAAPAVATATAATAAPACCATMASLRDLAFEHEGRSIQFDGVSGSVSWRSTHSSSVLSSSCEAEIYAGSMAAQELCWLTYLLNDLGGQPRSPPVLYVDNKAMIALCQEHRLEHRTKHIAQRYFLARDLQQCGQLRLAYVATRANNADIFTKARPHGLVLVSNFLFNAIILVHYFDRVRTCATITCGCNTGRPLCSSVGKQPWCSVGKPPTCSAGRSPFCNASAMLLRNAPPDTSFSCLHVILFSAGFCWGRCHGLHGLSA